VQPLAKGSSGATRSQVRRGRLSQPATIGRLVLGHRGDRSGKQRRTYFCGTYVTNARRTLAVICTILALLLSGVGFLMQTYHIGALYQEQPGYQSIISQLVAAVVGRGVTYYVAIGSLLAVLALSANTSFADFSRLCRLLAKTVTSQPLRRPCSSL
jgi:hypothetical protein